MKKSTVLMLIGIYVASIIAISFFGLAPKLYDEVIPATKIELINVDEENIEIIDSPTYDMRIDITTKSDPSERNILVLRPKISPYNATNKEVLYVYSPNDARYIFQETDGRKNGTIEFFSQSYTYSFKVEIKADDGRGAEMEILIRVIPE